MEFRAAGPPRLGSFFLKLKNNAVAHKNTHDAPPDRLDLTPHRPLRTDFEVG